MVPSAAETSFSFCTERFVAETPPIGVTGSEYRNGIDIREPAAGQLLYRNEKQVSTVHQAGYRPLDCIGVIINFNKGIDQSVYFLEMTIGCDQFGTVFHRLCRYPDIIGRDRRALPSELDSNS